MAKAKTVEELCKAAEAVWDDLAWMLSANPFMGERRIRMDDNRVRLARAIKVARDENEANKRRHFSLNRLGPRMNERR